MDREGANSEFWQRESRGAAAPGACGIREAAQRTAVVVGSGKRLCACAPVRLRGLLTLMPKYRLETRGRRRPVYWYRR